MKRLIVNADDFGLTAQVSKGIMDAHRHGVVTSTTLLANGGAVELAVSMARRAPELGIGVHLNLTEGVPVSPIFNVPTLVNGSGRLHLTPARLGAGIFTGKVRLSDVERELRAQIQKVLRVGILPTHLDGHKHVHVLPGISEIVIRLAQQFGIRGIRCPAEEAPNLVRLLGSNQSTQTPVIKQYLLGRAAFHFARRFKEKLAQAGLICAGHFYGLSQTGFLDAVGLQDILRRLPHGASELMCHPGYVDADLMKTPTRLLAQREVEIQALIAFEIRKLVKEQGIRLMNYRDLVASAEVNEAAA